MFVGRIQELSRLCAVRPHRFYEKCPRACQGGRADRFADTWRHDRHL